MSTVAPPLQRRPAAAEWISAPNSAGTAFLLLGLLLTWAAVTGSTPTVMARTAAIGAGIAIGGSLVLDLRNGIYSVLRPDTMALVALYGLTLLEFLFPQPNFDFMVSAKGTEMAITAVLVGFGGIGIGRSISTGRAEKMKTLFRTPVPPTLVIRLFWICAAIGYLNMLIAVGFSVVDMIHYFGSGRFTQPWQRPKFGNWSSLFYELSMLIMLIPPLAGVVFARATKFTKAQLIQVGVILAVTFFYGFASGTRNQFGSYIIAFVAAYLIAQPPRFQFGSFAQNARKYALVGVILMLSAVGMYHMLAFRNMGLWTYLALGQPDVEYMESTVFVDYNLWAISEITEVFPDEHEFLGSEIAYLGLIRPIPRAMWPGKPEGLSMSIEDAVGASQMTVAASFVGEAYMSGGLFGVFLFGLFFGLLARWWSGFGGPYNSDLGVLIYASGFFAIAVGMRSSMTFTTVALPSIAALAFAWLFARKYTPAPAPKAVPAYR